MGVLAPSPGVPYHQVWPRARPATHFLYRGTALALLLREVDVRSLLPMSTAIDLLREAFREQGRGDAINRPRTRIAYPNGLVHYMAAAIPAQSSVGLKMYVSTAAGTRFVALLFDAGGDGLLAILEADWLGRIRTGAASGLATDVLARSDARVAGVIGAGGQARTQIEALALVRDLDLIKIFSRHPETREALAAALSDTVACRIEAVDSADAAISGSDIVTTITTSKDPVFDGARLADGAHVNAAGANSLQRREIDSTTIARAAVVATDSIEQARIESGDISLAVQEGAASWDEVSELGAVLVGNSPGRRDQTDVTVFLSQGIAVEDVAVARYVYERALIEGRGVNVPFGGAA